MVYEKGLTKICQRGMGVLDFPFFLQNETHVIKRKWDDRGCNGHELRNEKFVIDV